MDVSDVEQRGLHATLGWVCAGTARLCDAIHDDHLDQPMAWGFATAFVSSRASTRRRLRGTGRLETRVTAPSYQRAERQKDTPMPAEPSLYERIGGQPAVDELITAFYGRVLADPALAPFFSETPIDRLQTMQREFFAAALGGPIRYSGASLVETHAGRGITTRHLARFVEHLLETLRSQGLQEEDVLEIISRINTYATEITGEVGVDG